MSRSSVGEVVLKQYTEQDAEIPGEPVVDKAVPVGEWSNKPSLGDQFINDRWESAVRLGPPQVAVFELPTQQAAANSLLARSKPDGAPELVVFKNDPMIVDNKLFLFVLYQTVEYRRIIGDPSQ